jgi:hypothetical protein
MPAVITHYTFALQSMLDPSEKFRAATLVGAQGPDPFFFYGQVPFRKRKGAEQIDTFGSDLHHTELSFPYNTLIQLANKSPDKELLFAYIDGLLLHYCLDRNCHPYVFYMTGFTDQPGEKKRFSISHMYLETILDFLLGKEKGTFGRPDHCLDLPKDDALKIGALWNEMNGVTLQKDFFSDKTFFLALCDYRAALRASFSKTGKKKALFKKIFGSESHAWAMSYPQNLDDLKGIDFLNVSHTEWFDPVSGASHQESFYDLMEQAAKDYQRAHELLLKAKSGAPIEDELHDFVAGIDHDGVLNGAKKSFQTFIWPHWPL